MDMHPPAASTNVRYRVPHGVALERTICHVRLNMERTIREAKTVCVSHPGSKECQVAWSTVEELSETLHGLKSSRLTVQDIVCSATPDDLECRVYDI